MSGDNKYVQIGHGDDMVEHWDHGFDEVMPQIETKLMDLEMAGIDPDWEVIFAGIKPLQFVYVDGSSTSYQLFENLDGTWIESEQWGGEMPGRSGTLISVEVEEKKLDEILGLMKVALERLSSWAEQKIEDRLDSTTIKPSEGGTTERASSTARVADVPEIQKVLGVTVLGQWLNIRPKAFIVETSMGTAYLKPLKGSQLAELIFQEGDRGVIELNLDKDLLKLLEPFNEEFGNL